MTSMKSNLVANRYASSLLDIAAEKKKVEKIEKDQSKKYRENDYLNPVSSSNPRGKGL